MAPDDYSITQCQDYMRMEYGDEVSDSVSSCLEFVRHRLLVWKVEKILTASKILSGVQSGDKMTTWTQMRVNREYSLSHNLVKTTITISSIHGEYTESVVKIKQKLKDNHLLPHVRKMFEIMDSYYEEIK